MTYGESEEEINLLKKHVQELISDNIRLRGEIGLLKHENELLKLKMKKSVEQK